MGFSHRFVGQLWKFEVPHVLKPMAGFGRISQIDAYIRQLVSLIRASDLPRQAYFDAQAWSNVNGMARVSARGR